MYRLDLMQENLKKIKSIIVNDPECDYVDLEIINEKETQILAEGLKENGPNTHLGSLELQKNTINNISVVNDIITIIKYTSITILTLTNFDFVGKIFHTLYSNTRVKRLCLNKNNFTNCGIICLCQLIEINTTITELNLMNNGFTQMHINLIINSLKKNTTIDTLELNYNTISNENINKLFETLKINNTIKNISLEYTEINDDDIYVISEFIKVNNTLNHLNLGGNIISDLAIQALIDALKINNTITSLSLISEYNSGDDYEYNKSTIESIDKLTYRNRDFYRSQFWTPHLHLTEFPDSFHESLITSLLCNGSDSGNIPTLPLNIWLFHIFPLFQIKSFIQFCW